MKYACSSAPKLSVRVTLTVATLFAAAFTDVAAQQGRIVGRVLGSAGGQAIPAAEVRVDGTTRWTTAQDDGRYVLSAPAGTYTLTVTALGYRTMSIEIDVSAGGTATVDFRLDPRPLAVQGIEVTTLRPDLQPSGALQSRDVEEANPKDAGELLRAIAGVEAVRRGPLGLDPVGGLVELARREDGGPDRLAQLGLERLRAQLGRRLPGVALGEEEVVAAVAPAGEVVVEPFRGLAQLG